jgi:hypothetical protein
MSTIFEISTQLDISLRTLRKLEKAGYLKATKSADPISDAARANLKKGNRLTALQQLHLLRNPGARESLSQYEFEIDAQLEKLGEAIAEAAPWDISSAIELAARREQGAIDKISNWLYNLIQVSESFDKGAMHNHAFIAVRLLAEIPEHSLVDLSKKAQACLWQCRRSAKLSDCWKLTDKGETVYFRPNKKALANFDL